MTLRLSDAPEVRRRLLAAHVPGAPARKEPEEEGYFFGFPVDAGPGSWSSAMDSPTHLWPGVANVPTPGATDGQTIVLVHSGWGDGTYPVIGGYDAADQLVAIRVDFGVVGGPE